MQYWCMPQHSTSLDADGKAIDDRSLADKDEFKCKPRRDRIAALLLP